MKFLKKILLVVIIITNILFTGCWNYRELEKLGLVTGVAIDKNLSKGTYEITVELLSTSGSKNQSKMASEIYSAEGKTIFDAMRNVILSSGKKLFWSHSKVIIVSNNIAAEGIAPIIDWFNRDSELRPNTWVLIARSGPASQILKSKSSENEIVAFHLDEIMRSQNPIYKFPQMDVWRFRKDLSSKTNNAIAPAVKQEIEKGVTSLQVFGTAVFKGDKLIGWLNDRETFSFLLISGKVKEGLIPLKNVEDTNTDVTLEIFNTKVKLIPILDDSNLSINIDVKATVAIDELAGSTDFISEPGNEKLKEQAEKMLKKELQEVIKKVQLDYKSDIFDFGGVIKRQYPSLWKKIEPNHTNFFSKLQVKVNVDLTIKGSGRTAKPIEIGE